MRSAFEKVSSNKPIEISLHGEGANFECILKNDNEPYSKWQNVARIGSLSEYVKSIKHLGENGEIAPEDMITNGTIKSVLENRLQALGIKGFVIYSPENSALRTFDKEGQIEPLGINGEGLLKLLSFHKSKNNGDKLRQIKNELEMIDWFEDFVVSRGVSKTVTDIEITDRYIGKDSALFNQRNVNEGFLFLLFYFTLFCSEETPAFFAIDNLEASLNP